MGATIHGALLGVVLWFAGAAVAGAAGMRPDQEELQRWFAQEWKDAAAKKVPDLDGLKVTWQIEDHWAPPADEVRRIREELKGHPDHPDRIIVPIWEARRAGKPSRGVREIWSRGTDEWRMNMSCPDLPSEYEDEVVTRERIWAMNKGFLGFASHTVPDPEHDIKLHHRMVLNELRTLLRGGLAFATQPNVKCPIARFVDETRWEASYTTKEVGGVHIEGDWDNDAGRGFVRHILMEGGTGTGITHIEVNASGWRHLGVGDHWVAQRVEWFRFDPKQLDRVTIFDGIRPLDDGEFDRLTRIPEYNGEDAIRGKVTFQAIEDLRPEVRELQVLTPGKEEVRPLPPITPPKKEISLIRTTGWVCLGCVVSAFLFLVIRPKMLAV